MSQGKPSSEDGVFSTTCASHCGSACLLKVHVQKGIITRIETDDGEEPQLRACLKGRAQRQRIYAPDRLKFPLKRIGPRGEGKFQRISWDEALDTVAGQWKRIRDSYGPSAIVADLSGGDLGYVHTGPVFGQLFREAGGCTRTWANWSFIGGNVASEFTYGTQHASNTRDDLPNSKFIIMWGWDPAVTIGGTGTSLYLTQAREKGARIISIGPRYTNSAATFAHQWIPIRPSTDTAMAIAMAHVMIAENLYDRGFIDTYTTGFDQFKDYVLGLEDGVVKSPAWAAEITGVPVATIETLAREFATTKPAALMAGAGPGRTAYGEQYHRATITLAVMTGNLGIKGGASGARAHESIFGGYPYDMPWFKDTVYWMTERDCRPQPKGVLKPNVIHRTEVPEFILQGNCKMLFLVSTNQLNQNPGINKMVKAYQVPEFIAVLEQFVTPTAKFADIVLPTNTFVERNDITVGVSLPFIGFMNKIIDPIGESKSPRQIGLELARRMGITTFKEEAEELREMVEQCRLTDSEASKARGVHPIKLKEPDIAFKEQISDPEKHPFPTPSGKIEIYSQRLADLGDPEIPPIPKYLEAKESWRSELAKKYPLQFINTHSKNRALSQFSNIPWLKELGGQELWIHSKDAGTRAIMNGDMVKVFNDRGALLIRAKVTERIMPGVVQMPQGAWYDPDENGLDRGACANVLTSEEHSPLGAYHLNTNLVEVEKYQE